MGHGRGATRRGGSERASSGASPLLPGTSWEEHWPGVNPSWRATDGRPMLSETKM